MNNNICHITFPTYKISNPIGNDIFSWPNNKKYLVPSLTTINSLTLSNLILDGTAPIKVLYIL